MRVHRKIPPVVAAMGLSLIVGCGVGEIRMSLCGIPIVLNPEDPEHKKRRMLPVGVKGRLGPVTWEKALRASERVMREHFPVVRVLSKERMIESDIPIRDEADGEYRRIALLRLSRVGKNVNASLYVGRYCWDTEYLRDDLDDFEEVVRARDSQPKLAQAILEQIEQELDVNAPETPSEGSAGTPAK